MVYLTKFWNHSFASDRSREVLLETFLKVLAVWSPGFRQNSVTVWPCEWWSAVNLLLDHNMVPGRQTGRSELHTLHVSSIPSVVAPQKAALSEEQARFVLPPAELVG